MSSRHEGEGLVDPSGWSQSDPTTEKGQAQSFIAQSGTLSVGWSGPENIEEKEDSDEEDKVINYATSTRVVGFGGVEMSINMSS